MITAEKIEEITGFVQRYMAIDASAQKNTDPGGYFAFYAGPSHRRCASARRRIEIRGGEDPTQIVATVIARVRDVIQSGEGNCYLRFYLFGESSPEEQIFIPGRTSDADEGAAVDDGTPIGALVSALVVGKRHDLERIRELERRSDQQSEALAIGREQVTLLAVAHEVLRESSKQQATAAAIQSFAPVVGQVLPELLARLRGGPAAAAVAAAAAASSASSASDATPEAQIDESVAAIIAAATKLYNVARAHPDAVGARLEPLRQIVAAMQAWFAPVVPPDQPPEAPTKRGKGKPPG